MFRVSLGSGVWFILVCFWCVIHSRVVLFLVWFILVWFCFFCGSFLCGSALCVSLFTVLVGVSRSSLFAARGAVNAAEVTCSAIFACLEEIDKFLLRRWLFYQE
ncbi:hypothetical protein DSO57_1039593 [Entomophthora muscae]|uniref:Uncharacterized protein n=1 Tax=Entomophthora muscae TaxID=34485 RepID=A0ACC2UD38_9FUNG|nr:hypothetical protein DSO57_1039593 [Entomophthora muscae]